MLHADVLGERRRLTPEKTALVVVDPPLRLSYAELDDRAQRCARLWCERLGLRAGERVGLLAHNRVEFLEAFFACAKSGVILVPLGTRLTVRELAHIVGDSGLVGVVYDGEFAEVVRELREQVTVSWWLALDEAAGPEDAAYHDLLDQLGQGEWRGQVHDPEALCCLLYTSGTTGAPKGVQISHRMVGWNAVNTVCSWQLGPGDTSPVFTPLYHAGGLMAFLMPLFSIGGTVVLHRRFDPGEVWRTIVTEQCTVVLGVPTIWKVLLEAPELEAVDLTHVRWLISGGAPLPTYLIEAYQGRGLQFKQGYGMTEVGVNCFAMSLEDSRRKLGSIGRPMMFTEVKLIDDGGNEVVVGEVGELCFRGPHVSSGYWNAPAATAEVFGDDGWFRSGDLARCDSDGFYTIAGRRKDMIISGGVNIYPAEIEGVLVTHPGVAEAAVVAVPDPHWGEVGIAFVVPTSVVEADFVEALDEFVGRRLARYKRPRQYRAVAELPRTALGKVIKGQLRDEYLRDPSAAWPGEPAS